MKTNRHVRLLIFFLVCVFIAQATQGICAPVRYLKSNTRMEVILGRLCFLMPSLRSANRNLQVNGSQRVLLQLEQLPHGLIRLNYACSTPQEFALINVQNSFNIQKFWVLKETNRYIYFAQKGFSGSILLETGSITEEINEIINKKEGFPTFTEIQQWHEKRNEKGLALEVKSWEAQTFWELVLSQNPECCETLQTLLARQRGDDTLQSLRGDFFTRVIDCNEKMPAQGDSTTTTKFSEERIKALVQQLGSDDFNERRQADCELRTVDPMQLFASPALRNTLDPEAQFRLTQIMNAIEMRIGGLTSPEIILWDTRSWVKSPNFWVSVLEFGKPAQRAYAWTVLCERFLPAEEVASMHYDPEKDAEDQMEVLQKIRERIE